MTGEKGRFRTRMQAPAVLIQQLVRWHPVCGQFWMTSTQGKHFSALPLSPCAPSLPIQLPLPRFSQCFLSQGPLWGKGSYLPQDVVISYQPSEGSVWLQVFWPHPSSCHANAVLHTGGVPVKATSMGMQSRAPKLAACWLENLIYSRNSQEEPCFCRLVFTLE